MSLAYSRCSKLNNYVTKHYEKAISGNWCDWLTLLFTVNLMTSYQNKTCIVLWFSWSDANSKRLWTFNFIKPASKLITHHEIYQVCKVHPVINLDFWDAVQKSIFCDERCPGIGGRFVEPFKYISIFFSAKKHMMTKVKIKEIELGQVP